MFPSKLARSAGRVGMVSAVASGIFAIALAASPAYAIGAPTLGAGSPCPAPALTSLIPSGLACVNGVLSTITSQLPIPTPPPATSAPKAAASPTPAPQPAPNPLSGLVSGVSGTVSNLGKTVTGTVGTATGGLGGLTGGSGPAPGLPGAPSSAPTSIPTAGSGGAAAGSMGASGATSVVGPAAPGAKPKPTSNGSILLGPAAFLPGFGLTNLADLSSSSPLADSIPSPLLAGPETKLAAVRAPLIAAGERASTQANSLLTGFGGKALPGILVVLATAMVAAVGAGNLRAWQARLAAKRGR
jgi:hypothetical protein